MVKHSHSCLLCLCGNRVSRYILILAKLNGRGRPFSKDAKRGATLWHYLQEHLVGIRDEKVSFCEIWDNPTPPLFLVELLTSKHCRTWSKLDMINLNLWIDSVHWVISSAAQKHHLLVFFEIFLYLMNSNSAERVNSFLIASYSCIFKAN